MPVNEGDEKKKRDYHSQIEDDSDGVMTGTPLVGPDEMTDEEADAVRAELQEQGLVPAGTNSLIKNMSDQLRDLLLPLTDIEMEWVILRSQASTDSEASRRMGRAPDRPMPLSVVELRTGLKRTYSAELMQNLRDIASAVRRERVIAAQCMLERQLLAAVAQLANLVEDAESENVKLGAIKEVLDRNMGKAATSDDPSTNNLYAMANLVREIRESLPTAEMIDSQHRVYKPDYDDDEAEGEYDELAPDTEDPPGADIEALGEIDEDEWA